MTLLISEQEMITRSQVWIVGRMVLLNTFTLTENLLTVRWCITYCMVA